MNYTVYQALKSIDPGPANSTFSAMLSDVGNAILAVDSTFNNTIDNTLKQLQGGVNTGYNCFELQSGGTKYADFLAGVNANTTLNFYESRDLAYMESQPDVKKRHGDIVVESDKTLSDVDVSVKPKTSRKSNR